jgi:hypothetical protein
MVMNLEYADWKMYLLLILAAGAIHCISDLLRWSETTKRLKEKEKLNK